MADTRDLKSLDENRVGSTPTSRTIYKPHPKQIEFFDRETDVLFSGAYPTRANGILTLEIIKRFINEI